MKYDTLEMRLNVAFHKKFAAKDKTVPEMIEAIAVQFDEIELTPLEGNWRDLLGALKWGSAFTERIPFKVSLVQVPENARLRLKWTPGNKNLEVTVLRVAT